MAVLAGVVITVIALYFVLKDVADVDDDFDEWK